ncbi:uncharacterized protein PHALS_07798 [Plasmopara halstedii]|uniref:Uncharacterized protein n=1 Tax=Plasmopara halstedii TaxID=4781 RepID=A0A0P1B5H0_PLAHL|nr:uncharacterized protein PHALS_07798 [Plasmopara halstedii]CEG50070.1 hypothetical protein PHALS_07798 [Plasmopara halstedii]|eukprot:XP_024586439.1 hypothetical protein PHALS_07798 [Plasmopara halstedii]
MLTVILSIDTSEEKQMRAKYCACNICQHLGYSVGPDVMLEVHKYGPLKDSQEPCPVILAYGP